MKKKRIVLILGASSEIGIEVVKKFIQEEWFVIAHFHKNSNQLKKFNSLYIKTIKADLFNLSDVTKLIKVISKFNIVSYVNLVGYLDNKTFLKTNLKLLIKSLTINTLAPNIIKRSLINKMKKQKFGRILDISSIGLKFGGSHFSYNYTFSKNALEFMPVFFKDLTKKNILSNVLRVGVVDTKLLRKIKGKSIARRKKLIPIRRFANTKEISEIIFNLASDKNSYISGQVIAVSGGE